MATVPTPVLDLTTVTERRIIAIDGHRYEMRDPSEVTIEQQVYLERAMPKLGALLIDIGAGSTNKHVHAEAEQMLQRICELAIVDAPPRVLKALKIQHRISICHVFLKLPTPTAAQTEALQQAVMARNVTGARSSRNSSGSMAAIRSAGTRRSRSSSSART